MHQNNVVFIKVHKCSSTSVRKIIEHYSIHKALNLLDRWSGIPHHKRKSSPNNIHWIRDNDWSTPVQQKYNISTRHKSYEERFFNKYIEDPKYVSFVRHPLVRALSTFHSTDTPPHKKAKGVNISFESWWYSHRQGLKQPLCLETKTKYACTTDNHMSYMLGYDSMEDINYRSLNERYEYIGLTEQFDKSIDEMWKSLGWEKIWKTNYPVIRNNGSGLNRLTGCSKTFIKDFEEANQLDYKLYNLVLSGIFEI